MDLWWEEVIPNNRVDLFDGDKRVALLFRVISETTNGGVSLIGPMSVELMYSIPSRKIVRALCPADEFQEAVQFVEAQYILSRGE